MKKIILYMLLSAIASFFHPALGQRDGSDGASLKNMTKLGSFSLDSENEKGEKDPVWKGPPREKPKYLVNKTAGTVTKLIDMPQAQQIINKIADALTKKGMNISILSQHKYMINQCLGIKASVGEFKIKLGNPVAKLETGGIFLQFTIDEVKITGLTIRMRPCPTDAQCHFGGRFDVGGSASNVRLEIRINPLVDLKNCQVFSGPSATRFKWRIGGLNLKPLQNNLDEVAKNLIEDALTTSALLYMPHQIIDASISAIFDENLCSGMPVENDKDNNPDKEDNNDNSNVSDPKLNELEERVQILEGKVKSLEKSSNVTSLNKADTKNSSALNKPKEKGDMDAEKWVITPTGAKGATGTVSINLPEGVEWHLDITTSQDRALGKWDDRWNNKKTINLIPGEYNIFFTYIPVRGVPVQKGMNTRLKAGILDVVSAGQWTIWNEEKTKVHVVYYKPSKIALPIGRYNLQYNGQYIAIEIKEGEVTEL